MNKDSVLVYYERLTGSHPNEPPAKQASFASGHTQVFYGHFLDYAHYGSLAQIRLSYLNTRALSDAVRGSSKQFVESEVRCLVDMTTLLQLGIIKALYLEQ